MRNGNSSAMRSSAAHPPVETVRCASRLPKHGRCVTSAREMDRIASRKSVSTGYVVEVCPACRWNHLTESRAIGGA